MTDERFSVLLVCHANLCRSPMAERLAHRALAERMGPPSAGFEVSSAGTHACAGLPMHPHATAVLRQYGADDAGFRSRRVTPELIGAADLVLTAAREQRAACATLAPTAVRRILTLREFGRLAAKVPVGGLKEIWPPQARLRALIDELPAARARLPVASSIEDDLPDPVNEPIATFRRCAREIRSVTDLMIDIIAPI